MHKERPHALCNKPKYTYDTYAFFWNEKKVLEQRSFVSAAHRLLPLVSLLPAAAAAAASHEVIHILRDGLDNRMILG